MMEKIILRKDQNLRMHQGSTYIGSVINFNEDVEIDIDEIVNEYYISFYYQGLSFHFWCSKYVIEEVNKNEPENN